ncbi:hypothetical protein AVEN_205622-1 [Araneus ventricosus]|uniref:Uncharacterized protein n=1 Tax=Araneus ventricosus TaxID=182803 RepID=A0A4Y2IHN7_ARAVE|nr:hypothetical protein AVEN_205622-1 [Araneus ventricosus]
MIDLKSDVSLNEKGSLGLCAYYISSRLALVSLDACDHTIFQTCVQTYHTYKRSMIPWMDQSLSLRTAAHRRAFGVVMRFTGGSCGGQLVRGGGCNSKATNSWRNSRNMKSMKLLHRIVTKL